MVEQVLRSKSNSFHVNKIYLKDLSLEQPNSPKIFLETAVPEVSIDLKTSKVKLSDDLYECVLIATIQAMVNQQVLFLIEGSQAALINFSANSGFNLDEVLNVDVPALLLPYLRVNLADLLSRSGFPPVHLSDINFYELYKNHLDYSGKKSVTSEQI